MQKYRLEIPDATDNQFAEYSAKILNGKQEAAPTAFPPVPVKIQDASVIGISLLILLGSVIASADKTGATAAYPTDRSICPAFNGMVENIAWAQGWYITTKIMDTEAITAKIRLGLFSGLI